MSTVGSYGEIQTGITSRSVLRFNGAGIQMLWADGKKARRIKANMWKHNVKFHQLSYREMEHLRQVWARGKYPDVHGEIINQDPTSVSFVSCSSLVTHFPLPRGIQLLVRIGFIENELHSRAIQNSGTF